MPVQLSDNSVQGFDLARKPAYDRHDITPGILHIGIGGFHRAHQAVYTEDVLAGGDHRWGIIGASMRSTTMRNRLMPQNFLYTVCTRGADSNEYRVIGAVKDVLTISQHQHQLLDLIASPQIKVITLTITEKGYCLTPSQELDEQHPDIQQDLSNPGSPVSAPGLLATGLKRRMEQGSGPISIISCDNLSGNGRSTQKVVTTIAGLYAGELAHWIRDHVSFPNTMVDRIVPATSDADMLKFFQETGVEDNGVVICEPFSQWVIENSFAAERPEWESAGAQIVDDVAVYEQIKLRLLNTTHSALAYLGLLAGYEFIHEAMEDPTLSEFSAYLLDKEISPLLQCPDGFDLDSYKRSILQRFANPAIQYRTAQVANDGSHKLQQRIYPTITEHSRRNTACPGLNLVVAAWLHCLNTPKYASQFSDPAGEIIRTYSGGSLVERVSSESKSFGIIWDAVKFRNQIKDAGAALNQSSVRTLLQRIMINH
ncbi:MAG: mannitol dehydrogenase family protein [Gammaproteobacteria bacterium]|nr:mannitol dehydrogenase family protein [Gammaproteobacteria bacterium]MBT6583235.1 mannitol dehydrogenase family protein [Gammaproteobacteria bacterium]MBT6892865.1 mannitol dehydrogenase family protein [Gammaproteobacteria bacterium]